MSPTPSTFDQRLTTAMTACGISIPALVEQANAFSTRTVIRWRMGHAVPGIEALPILARVLDVSADWLLGGETGGPVPTEQEVTP